MKDFLDPEVLKEYKCSCEYEMSVGDHPETCDLWLSAAYAQGAADWDPSTRTLTLVEPGWSDEDWDLLNDDWSGELSGYGDALGVAPLLQQPATNNWGVATALFTKCRHYQQPVTLPDGTVVYASSHHRHDPERDWIPDLGVYLDGVWAPVSVAFLIGCPDFGTPLPSVDSVMHIANEALRIAREGGRVEIGCVGGHGRTGMFLAILTALTMSEPDGKKAVAFVRNTYCDNAVESPEQEWYVEGIACERLGKPWPEAPPKPKPIVLGETFTWQPGKKAAPEPTHEKGGTSKEATSVVVGAIEKLTRASNKPKPKPKK